MRIHIISTVLFLWMISLPATANKNEKAATNLAKRIIPKSQTKYDLSNSQRMKRKTFLNWSLWKEKSWSEVIQPIQWQ